MSDPMDDLILIPSDRVIHEDLGVGSVIHASLLRSKTLDETVGTMFFVEFDNGKTLSFSDEAALCELLLLDDNDFNCNFCGVSLQGEEIAPEDQPDYLVTHIAGHIQYIDEFISAELPVAYQCPDCDTIWSAFTGEKIKRMTHFWPPASLDYPKPISELGPFHIYNIRRYRRTVSRSSIGDDFDDGITREIRRRWYLLPIVWVGAPIMREIHDRKRRRKSKQQLARVQQILLEATNNIDEAISGLSQDLGAP